jgi:hypothetical protein
VRALLVLGLVAACGSARGRTAARPEPPPARHTEVVAAESPPSDDECDALIAHAIALGVAEQRERATEDEQARVHADLRSRYIAICRDMSRQVYACALAATSLAALEACPQPSRSSSTSNSSVEFGGITPRTPPAP